MLLGQSNAWEIHDKFNLKTVGYIDLGVNPDLELHLMAKINCPEPNCLATCWTDLLQVQGEHPVGEGTAGLAWRALCREDWHQLGDCGAVQ